VLQQTLTVAKVGDYALEVEQYVLQMTRRACLKHRALKMPAMQETLQLEAARMVHSAQTPLQDEAETEKQLKKLTKKLAIRKVWLSHLSGRLTYVQAMPLLPHLWELALVLGWRLPAIEHKPDSLVMLSPLLHHWAICYQNYWVVLSLPQPFRSTFSSCAEIPSKQLGRP